MKDNKTRRNLIFSCLYDNYRALQIMSENSYELVDQKLDNCIPIQNTDGDILFVQIDVDDAKTLDEYRSGTPMYSRYQPFQSLTYNSNSVCYGEPAFHEQHVKLTQLRNLAMMMLNLYYRELRAQYVQGSLTLEKLGLFRSFLCECEELKYQNLDTRFEEYKQHISDVLSYFGIPTTDDNIFCVMYLAFAPTRLLVQEITKDNKITPPKTLQSPSQENNPQSVPTIQNQDNTPPPVHHCYDIPKNPASPPVHHRYNIPKNPASPPVHRYHNAPIPEDKNPASPPVHHCYDIPKNPASPPLPKNPPNTINKQMIAYNLKANVDALHPILTNILKKIGDQVPARGVANIPSNKKQFKLSPKQKKSITNQFDRLSKNYLS